MDSEVEFTIYEFLDLRRKFSHLSGPIDQKVSDFIKSSSNEIRQLSRQLYVEDETESSDGGGQHDSHRSSAPLNAGLLSNTISSVGNEVQSQPEQNNLRSHDLGSNTRTESRESGASTVPGTPYTTTDIAHINRSREESNMSTSGPHPGAGHAGNEQLSRSNTAQSQEQEQLRRTGTLAGDANIMSAPSNDTQSNSPTTRESTASGSSVDTGTDGQSAEMDSTEKRTQPQRQAALRAKENFGGQSGQVASAKRRKRAQLTSAETEAVSWLENQVANAAALASTRELVNNWDRITETVFPMQNGSESLIARTMNNRPYDELSLFIYLGRRVSMSPTEEWASTALRRIHAAHFVHLYSAATEDARRGQKSSFFRLSDERLRQHGQIPVRKCYQGYGSSSAVRDRLLDLLFSDPQQCPQISRDQCRQRIHLTQQDGKRWRYLIQRMDYKILFCLPPEITDNRMKLTDTQMESFVLACENRLGQLCDAQFMEFEVAMEMTFMPYIRTQLEIFDAGRGFSALPGMGIPETNDLVQREDTFSALPSLSTSPLTSLSPSLLPSLSTPPRSPSDDMAKFFDFESGEML